ncbi:MAG TPA: hypothetical protein VJB68_04970, partial [Methylophilaceae bacterium]|nr:hypothetical protein [Methylophilaceae bacterium]
TEQLEALGGLSREALTESAQKAYQKEFGHEAPTTRPRAEKTSLGVIDTPGQAAAPAAPVAAPVKDKQAAVDQQAQKLAEKIASQGAAIASPDVVREHPAGVGVSKEMAAKAAQIMQDAWNATIKEYKEKGMDPNENREQFFETYKAKVKGSSSQADAPQAKLAPGALNAKAQSVAERVANMGAVTNDPTVIQNSFPGVSKDEAAKVIEIIADAWNKAATEMKQKGLNPQANRQQLFELYRQNVIQAGKLLESTQKHESQLPSAEQVAVAEALGISADQVNVAPQATAQPLMPTVPASNVSTQPQVNPIATMPAVMAVATPQGPAFVAAPGMNILAAQASMLPMPMSQTVSGTQQQERLVSIAGMLEQRFINERAAVDLV